MTNSSIPTSEFKLRLTPQLAKLLLERATLQGLDVNKYVTKLIDRDLARPNIDEILAPFRQEVAGSGMTQAELDEFFKNARKEVARAKQATPGL